MKNYIKDSLKTANMVDKLLPKVLPQKYQNPLSKLEISSLSSEDLENAITKEDYAIFEMVLSWNNAYTNTQERLLGKLAWDYSGNISKKVLMRKYHYGNRISMYNDYMKAIKLIEDYLIKNKFSMK